ncbi:MAG TPA: hypothetical protein VH207_12740 [Chthoniobacterales bacterium]|jgi:hypothetical protein|nr:hypothetical protein [Chthoniobacterales bacterium]
MVRKTARKRGPSPPGRQYFISNGTCLYDTSKEALKSLCEGFNYWTGKLTESSFALSLGVIGANWAVFGSVDKIRHNLLAEISMSLVVGSLVVGLFGNWLLGGMLRKRIRYGERGS